jgi:hypothetical protein
MATINTSELTQASALTTSAEYVVTGTGVFDDLMEAVNIHLSAQFQLGRITGADYATVYLGAVQSSMQQSVAFILGKQQADKQADLLDKQILTEVKKTLDVTSTTAVRDAQSAKDLLVKAGQITSMTKDDAVKTNQALDVLSQTSVRNAQSVKDLLVKQEQIDMSVAQQATEAKKTLDVVSTTSVRDAQSIKDALVKDAQVAKTTAENSLLGQKEITEYAQTQQTTKIAPNTASILGRQATLYEEQAKGFQWNADQKYLDTLLRAWGMNVNTAGVPSTAVNAFAASGTVNINTVISDGKPT